MIRLARGLRSSEKVNPFVVGPLSGCGFSVYSGSGARFLG